VEFKNEMDKDEINVLKLMLGLWLDGWFRIFVVFENCWLNFKRENRGSSVFE
jgi:hypothetical protein